MGIPIKRYWALLAHYLKPQLKQVSILGFLLIGGIVTRLVNPMIVGRFIDIAKLETPLQVLMNTALLFMGIVVVEQILLVLATYFSENVGWTATNRLREDLALHCLKLDPSFHKTRTPGEMIERIDGDVNELTTFFSQFVLVLIGHSLLLVGILALLWRVDWRIGLPITLIALGGLGIINYVRAILVPYWQSVQQGYSELFGFLEERFNGLEEIRVNNATHYVMRGLYNQIRGLFDREYKAKRLFVWTVMLPPLVFGLAYGVTFFWGDTFVSTTVTIGTIYTVIYYLELLWAPLWEITIQIQNLQRAEASINRAEELLRIENRINDGPGEPLPQGPLKVEFNNISFRYEVEGELILSDITFQLEPGKVLGLIGRTGSGKSTLTRLLFRFYDPTSGMICLGDGNGQTVNISQTKVAALRKRIGLVTQDVQLFQATVRDNVTFFDKSISDDKILSVIHDLTLDDWLASLPDGLNTVLAPGGQSVSGGQAQLLAFIRVFLRNPGVIVLDEASSRLDYATERLIKQAMDKLFQGRTGIIIAHRMETIQWVDEIIVLENGRIHEYGPRHQLLTDVNSHYYQLLQN